jgi:hypothetical protein
MNTQSKISKKQIITTLCFLYGTYSLNLYFYYFEKRVPIFLVILFLASAVQLFISILKNKEQKIFKSLKIRNKNQMLILTIVPLGFTQCVELIFGTMIYPIICFVLSIAIIAFALYRGIKLVEEV